MTSVGLAIPDVLLPSRDSVSRLQDTTAQIRDIARCVFDSIASFARDEATPDLPTHKTLWDLESGKAHGQPLQCTRLPIGVVNIHPLVPQPLVSVDRIKYKNVYGYFPSK